MSLFILNNSKKIINWEYTYKNLSKLQNRIVKQIEKKKYRKSRNIQRLILKKFSSHLIISQKIIENQNIDKLYLYKLSRQNHFINILNLSNYIQFEKVFNLKFDGIYYQFLYMLWVLALLPIHETYSEPFSYNYRLYRNHTDVLKDIFITIKKPRFKWILIIKPTGFFSQRNKKWLSHNLLIEKKFFNCFLDSKRLANLSINDYKYNQGLIDTLQISLTKIVKTFSMQGYNSFLSISLNIHKKKRLPFELYSGPIFYYNNLILIPNTHLTNLKISYQSIFKFLKTRGLGINKNRIWALNLNKGFNFLGFFLKKEKKEVKMQISYQNIRSHKLEIRQFLKSSRFLPIDKVIHRLNEKIIRWQTYYAYTPNLYRTWSEMNYYLFWRIWRWCKRRHKNKGSKWLYQKYWSYSQKKRWIFHNNNLYLKSYELKKQKIIQIAASINACKKEDLKKIQQILFYRYTHFITRYKNNINLNNNKY